MKIIALFLFLTTLTSSSQGDDPQRPSVPLQEFQDIADHIARRLKADKTLDNLMFMFNKVYHNKHVGWNVYDEVKVIGKSIDGLNSLKLEVDEGMRDEKPDGPSALKGTVTLAPIKVTGNVTYSLQQGKGGEEEWEIKILSSAPDPIRFNFLIRVENHGRGKVLTTLLETEWHDYSYDAKMTSCDIKKDETCYQLLHHFFSFDEHDGEYESIMGQKLMEMIENMDLSK